MTDTGKTGRLRDSLAVISRVSLGHFPTPLTEAPRLSERLGVRVLVKRDDQTGLALGGNKVRKLEFLVAAAREYGADTIITTGGSQSNHARLTAAACRLTGMDCHLVLDRSVHPDQQGNMLLDALLGAHVHIIDSANPVEATAAMELLAATLRDQGHRPFVIPRGGSIPEGAVGYAAFVVEFMQQLQDLEVSPSWLYLGTGSTGTHSGILAGLAASKTPFQLQGISVSRAKPDQVSKILDLTTRTLSYLGIDVPVSLDTIHVDDRFRGPGYGYTTNDTLEAIEIAARDEGIILDPVYTGKTMAGLIGHAREGRFASSETVIFLHTGGSPALFAYHRELAEYLAVHR